MGYPESRVYRPKNIPRLELGGGSGGFPQSPEAKKGKKTELCPNWVPILYARLHVVYVVVGGLGGHIALQ